MLRCAVRWCSQSGHEHQSRHEHQSGHEHNVFDYPSLNPSLTHLGHVAMSREVEGAAVCEADALDPAVGREHLAVPAVVGVVGHLRYISSASAAHQQRINSESAAHQQCINSASAVHQQCIHPRYISCTSAVNQPCRQALA